MQPSLNIYPSPIEGGDYLAVFSVDGLENGLPLHEYTSPEDKYKEQQQQKQEQQDEDTKIISNPSVTTAVPGENDKFIVIVDCSGSMGDFAAEIIKKTLPKVFEALEYAPEHEIDLIVFGCRAYLDKQKVANFPSLKWDSDLGGTAMEHVFPLLTQVLQSYSYGTNVRILTVSDGEVNSIDRTVSAASKCWETLQDDIKGGKWNIQSHAIRFYTGWWGSPDTIALSTVLKFHNIDSEMPKLVDHSEDKTQKIERLIEDLPSGPEGQAILFSSLYKNVSTSTAVLTAAPGVYDVFRWANHIKNTQKLPNIESVFENNKKQQERQSPDGNDNKNDDVTQQTPETNQTTPETQKEQTSSSSVVEIYKSEWDQIAKDNMLATSMFKRNAWSAESLPMVQMPSNTTQLLCWLDKIKFDNYINKYKTNNNNNNNDNNTTEDSPQQDQQPIIIDNLFMISDVLPVKVIIHPYLTFSTYTQMMSAKIDHFIMTAKLLRVAGDNNSLDELQKIANYFSSMEQSLNDLIQTHPFLRGDVIIDDSNDKDEDDNNNNTTCEEQNKLTQRFIALQKKYAGIDKSLGLRLKEIANIDRHAKFTIAQATAFLRGGKNAGSAKAAKGLSRRNGEDLDFTENIRDEIVQLVNNLDKFEATFLPEEEEKLPTSFVSLATTLDGLRTLRSLSRTCAETGVELTKQDAEGTDTLLDKLSALEMLSFINLVGVPVQSVVGYYPNPYEYNITTMFSGHYCSFSDYITQQLVAENEAKEQNSDKINIQPLTIPGFKGQDGRVDNVIPIFENTSLFKFIYDNAPRTLSYYFSLGVRRLIADVPQTIEAVLSAALLKIAKVLSSEPSENNLKTFYILYKNLQIVTSKDTSAVVIPQLVSACHEVQRQQQKQNGNNSNDDNITTATVAGVLPKITLPLVQILPYLMNLYRSTIIADQQNEQEKKSKKLNPQLNSVKLSPLLTSYQSSWAPIVTSMEHRLRKLMKKLFQRRFSNAIAAYQKRQQERQTRMDEIRKKQEESGYLPPPCTCGRGRGICGGRGRGRGGSSSNNRSRCLVCTRKDTIRPAGHTKNPKIKNIVWDSSYYGLDSMLTEASRRLADETIATLYGFPIPRQWKATLPVLLRAVYNNEIYKQIQRQCFKGKQNGPQLIQQTIDELIVADVVYNKKVDVVTNDVNNNNNIDELYQKYNNKDNKIETQILQTQKFKQYDHQLNHLHIIPYIPVLANAVLEVEKALYKVTQNKMDIDDNDIDLFSLDKKITFTAEHLDKAIDIIFKNNNVQTELLPVISGAPQSITRQLEFKRFRKYLKRDKKSNDTNNHDHDDNNDDGDNDEYQEDEYRWYVGEDIELDDTERAAAEEYVAKQRILRSQVRENLFKLYPNAFLSPNEIPSTTATTKNSNNIKPLQNTRIIQYIKYFNILSALQYNSLTKTPRYSAGFKTPAITQPFKLTLDMLKTIQQKQLKKDYLKDITKNNKNDDDEEQEFPHEMFLLTTDRSNIPDWVSILQMDNVNDKQKVENKKLYFKYHHIAFKPLYNLLSELETKLQNKSQNIANKTLIEQKYNDLIQQLTTCDDINTFNTLVKDKWSTKTLNDRYLARTIKLMSSLPNPKQKQQESKITKQGEKLLQLLAGCEVVIQQLEDGTVVTDDNVNNTNMVVTINKDNILCNNGQPLTHIKKERIIKIVGNETYTAYQKALELSNQQTTTPENDTIKNTSSTSYKYRPSNLPNKNGHSETHKSYYALGYTTLSEFAQNDPTTFKEYMEKHSSCCGLATIRQKQTPKQKDDDDNNTKSSAVDVDDSSNNNITPSKETTTKQTNQPTRTNQVKLEREQHWVKATKVPKYDITHRPRRTETDCFTYHDYHYKSAQAQAE